MKDPTAIYTREWYEHDFDGLQPEFDMVADAIVQVLYPEGKPLEAVDMGCGPGMLLDALHRKGVLVRGYDGSANAIAYARDHVRSVADRLYKLTVEQLATSEAAWAADLVICTEVAEHLEAEQAPTLCKVLRRHMIGPWSQLFFTAAPPGQGGHDHVNEQPMSYWEDLFAREGLTPAPESLQDKMRAAMSPLQRLSHMTRNVRVFWRSR